MSQIGRLLPRLRRDRAVRAAPRRSREAVLTSRTAIARNGTAPAAAPPCSSASFLPAGRSRHHAELTGRAAWHDSTAATTYAQIMRQVGTAGARLARC